MGIEIGRGGYIPSVEGSYKPKDEQQQGREERKKMEKGGPVDAEGYKEKAAKLERQAIEKRQKRGTDLAKTARVIGGMDAMMLQRKIESQLPPKEREEKKESIEPEAPEESGEQQKK